MYKCGLWSSPFSVFVIIYIISYISQHADVCVVQSGPK